MTWTWTIWTFQSSVKMWDEELQFDNWFRSKIYPPFLMLWIIFSKQNRERTEGHSTKSLQQPKSLNDPGYFLVYYRNNSKLLQKTSDRHLKWQNMKVNPKTNNRNKTYHPLRNHVTSTENEAIHCLKWDGGRWVRKSTGTAYYLNKVWSGAPNSRFQNHLWESSA